MVHAGCDTASGRPPASGRWRVVEVDVIENDVVKANGLSAHLPTSAGTDVIQVRHGAFGVRLGTMVVQIVDPVVRRTLDPAVRMARGAVVDVRPDVIDIAPGRPAAAPP